MHDMLGTEGNCLQSLEVGVLKLIHTFSLVPVILISRAVALEISIVNTVLNISFHIIIIF